MEELAKLTESFRQFAHKGGPLAIYDATVLAVDADAYTCDILLDGDVEVPQARLRAVVSDNQSIDILPQAGAAIVVGMMGDDDFIMLACDLISNYRITVGAVVFTLDATGTLISNGDETLKKILTDLVQAVISIGAPKDMGTLTALLLRINTLLK